MKSTRPDLCPLCGFKLICVYRVAALGSTRPQPVASSAISLPETSALRDSPRFLMIHTEVLCGQERSHGCQRKLPGGNLFIAVAEFDASEILHYQSVFDFFVVIEQDVEYKGFGVVRYFQPDNLRRVATNQ